MGLYTYLQQLWQHKQGDALRYTSRIRCWEWRHNHRYVRVSKPTRTDKAHRLGYKAKLGYAIWRVRIRRGGRKRKVHNGITHGKPRTAGVRGIKNEKNLQVIAEGRIGKHCGGLRVLNSYWVGSDATYKYFEVIMVDPTHKSIRADPRINWIVNPVHKHREVRGLTSSGRKHRGLRAKGHRANKLRPSWRRTWKRHVSKKFRRYR